MKHILSLTMALALLLAAVGLSGCQKSDTSGMQTHRLFADHQAYSTLDELKSTANCVIQGQVVYSRFEMLDISPDSDDDLFPYTISTVKITDVFKGDYKKGQTIKVKQLGGTDKGKRIQYVEESSELLAVNKEYVLFLATFEKSPSSPLNPTQAVYTVSDGKLLSHEKNSIQINDLSALRKQ